MSARAHTPALARARTRARASTSARATSKGPSRDLRTVRAGPETATPTRKQTFLDDFAISLFAAALARETRTDVGGDFNGVREACLDLVRTSTSARETRARAMRILKTLAPRWAFGAFAAILRLFPDWFKARHAAAVTPVLMGWLVGDAEVNDGGEGVTYEDGEKAPTSAWAALDPNGERAPAGYKQGVLLKRCRVLEETGCAAVCANVCKHPTQKFFTEDIGLAMTMTPNYETYECQFTYGAKPKEVGEDEAFKTPCFRQCTASTTMKDAQCGNCLDPDEAPESGTY